MIIPSDTLQEIQILLAQNRKVKAVALVKQVTQCSLKEAKDYIDQLDQTKKKITGNIDDQIRALLIQGKKIEAIKVYKDHSGRSLAASKEYVERLEKFGSKHSTIDRLLQEQEEAKPQRSYTWVIILVIAAAIIAWAFLRE